MIPHTDGQAVGTVARSISVAFPKSAAPDVWAPVLSLDQNHMLAFARLQILIDPTLRSEAG